MNENEKDWENPTFGKIYFVLALADGLAERDEIADWLNQNGFCNLTVCQTCRVDDFVHIEGCSVGKNIEKVLRALGKENRVLWEPE